jgi:hypothetical protein
MSEKKKLVTMTTPAGIAKYPWITKADTRFVPEGVFTTKLVLSKEAATPLMEAITKAHAEHWTETVAKTDPKKKKSLKKADLPFKDVLDDQGNETGDIEFVFKQKAVIVSKKDNKSYNIKINIFDAKGKPITKAVAIYGGSIIKVNFAIVPYATTMGVGVTLRLNAVQVIKLVSSGGDASSYGFGAEEDGYEFSEDEAGDASGDSGDSLDLPEGAEDEL